MNSKHSQRSNDGAIHEVFAERSPDGLFALSEDLEMVFINQTIEEITGRDREEIVGNHASVFLELDIVNQEAYDRAIEACTEVLTESAVSSRSFEIRLQTPEGPIETEFRISAVPEDHGQTAALVGTIRDISERVARKRRLERQRNELNSVSKIQSLIQRSIQSLSEAPTREAIRRNVCDSLVAAEYYESAWIADVEYGADELTNLYTAGVKSDLLASITEHGIEEQELSVVTEALDTGQPQVITDVESSPLLPPETRRLCAKHGHQSILTVPITINSSVVALLTVGTAREHAFGSRELNAFSVLADLIAFSLTAVEGKRLLLGEGTVEYEFKFPTGTVLAELTREYGGKVTLDTVLPISQQGCHCYFVAEPELPPELVKAVTASTKVNQFKLVDAWNSGTRYEAVLTDSPLVTLAETGTDVVGKRAVDGNAYIYVRTTKERSSAELLNALKETYPGVELVSQRIHESTETMASLSQWLDEHLTTKQRQMLEGAYYQGYFAWPRENSAEEVAESFGITSSTFHAHIRKANQTLLAAVFDGVES